MLYVETHGVGEGEIYNNVNNRPDDGDSLVNILAAVGSSIESRDFSGGRFKISVILS